jgi:hypothetical protein
MKVKNCLSDLHAKIKLEGFLKKKHHNFQRLQVIRCNEDNEIFSMLDQIFGKNFDSKA